jgi:hypothetical protein
MITFSTERADRAAARAEAVRALLDIAWSCAGEDDNIGEAVGVIMIALAIAEDAVGLKKSQTNEVLRDVRRSVAEAVRRLGPQATAIDIAIELDLLG